MNLLERMPSQTTYRIYQDFTITLNEITSKHRGFSISKNTFPNTYIFLEIHYLRKGNKIMLV